MTSVLIVDDHYVVRQGLKQILEQELGSVRFGEAGNAREALTGFWSANWDIVVLEWPVPKARSRWWERHAIPQGPGVFSSGCPAAAV